jgi:cyclomaltodextrinase
MRAAALILLTACTARVQAVPVPELELHEADVFTPSTRLQGRAPIEVAHCQIVLNGVAQATELHGRTFAAQLDVPPAHVSEARASCTDPRGRSLRSPTVKLHGMASASPVARATAQVEPGQLRLEGGASTSNAATHESLTDYTWTTEQGQALGSGASLRVPLPMQQGDHRYALQVRDAAGQVDTARVAITVTEQGARVLEGPSWLAGGTVYGVVPKLFGEPPLARVTAALDSLRELGVSALWLSPVFRTTPDDFGYAVTDSFHVREDYGGDAALESLLEAAHARGLRVLLDLVINHSSAQHRYFRDAEVFGTSSHYFHFYDRDPEGRATHYFDWTHLPNFDFANEEVVQWALAFSRQWLERGVDGYRVDAAWGVRQRSPTFYPRWASELRRVRPDAFLLAEAPAADPYYREHGFDAAYDWTEELGHHAWEHVFDHEPGIAERLAAAVARTPTAFHFLNNNDTGERFITRHGVALTRVATAALLTLPGVPCLYALDELGAEYRPYEEGAPRIAEQAGLRELHRTLIQLRKQTPAFQGDVYQPLHAEGELYAFARGTGRERAVVVLSFSAEPQVLELADSAGLVDALGAGPSRGKLALEPWATRIYLPQ